MARLPRWVRSLSFLLVLITLCASLPPSVLVASPTARPTARDALLSAAPADLTSVYLPLIVKSATETEPTEPQEAGTARYVRSYWQETGTQKFVRRDGESFSTLPFWHSHAFARGYNAFHMLLLPLEHRMPTMPGIAVTWGQAALIREITSIMQRKQWITFGLAALATTLVFSLTWANSTTSPQTEVDPCILAWDDMTWEERERCAEPYGGLSLAESTIEAIAQQTSAARPTISEEEHLAPLRCRGWAMRRRHSRARCLVCWQGYALSSAASVPTGARY